LKLCKQLYQIKVLIIFYLIAGNLAGRLAQMRRKLPQGFLRLNVPEV